MNVGGRKRQSVVLSPSLGVGGGNMLRGSWETGLREHSTTRSLFNEASAIQEGPARTLEYPPRVKKEPRPKAAWASEASSVMGDV